MELLFLLHLRQLSFATISNCYRLCTYDCAVIWNPISIDWISLQVCFPSLSSSYYFEVGVSILPEHKTAAPRTEKPCKEREASFIQRLCQLFINCCKFKIHFLNNREHPVHITVDVYRKIQENGHSKYVQRKKNINNQNLEHFHTCHHFFTSFCCAAFSYCTHSLCVLTTDLKGFG